MLRIFVSFVYLTTLTSSYANLHAIDVSNQANAYFPNVNEQRAEKLRGMGYEALDAANRKDIIKLHSLLYSIKTEVESMMGAQVRLEDFIDDAFNQIESKGKKFSDAQKSNMKRSLGVSSKGFSGYENEIRLIDGHAVINEMKGQAYVEQPYYKPSAALDAGVSMVIIGTLVSVIPLPCCTAAGPWLVGMGMSFIFSECVQGCERIDRKDDWVDIRQDRYRNN